MLYKPFIRKLLHLKSTTSPLCDRGPINRRLSNVSRYPVKRILNPLDYGKDRLCKTATSGVSRGADRVLKSSTRAYHHFGELSCRSVLVESANSCRFQMEKKKNGLTERVGSNPRPITARRMGGPVPRKGKFYVGKFCSTFAPLRGQRSKSLKTGSLVSHSCGRHKRYTLYS